MPLPFFVVVIKCYKVFFLILLVFCAYNSNKLNIVYLSIVAFY